MIIFDRRTGKVLDNDHVRGIETEYSMIVASGPHRAVLARNEGNPYVFAVDDRTGKLRWKSEPGHWFAGAGHGRVLVGTEKGCAVLRDSDGASIARCPEGAGLVDMDATRLASVIWSDDGGAEVVVTRIRT